MKSSPPYAGLSTFYFFYFAALGIFSPFWPVFLKNDLGFNAVQIGEILSVFMLSRLLGPFLLSGMADRAKDRIHSVRYGGIICTLVLAGIYLNDSFIWVLLITFTFGLFWNAILPQYEAFTLQKLASQRHRYSLIRVWGSIGFMLIVVGYPYVSDDTSSVPLLLLITLTLMTGASYLVSGSISDKKNKAARKEQVSDTLVALLTQPIIIALLIAAMLQSMSHAAYYTFFTIYLLDNGYSSFTSGLMWALGVLIEIFLFLMIHRFIHRYALSFLFSLALFLTTIRWLLMAFFVDHPTVLIIVQCLHAASFGLFHIAVMHLISVLFPHHFQGKGQAIYSGISYGLGGAIGSFVSGYLWQYQGSTMTFVTMSGIAFVAWLIATLFVRNIWEEKVIS